MSPEQLRNKVLEIVAEQLNVKAEEIRDDTDLAKDLGADSLDMVEIVMELEDALEIMIPDDNATPRTISEVVELVKKLQ